MARPTRIQIAKPDIVSLFDKRGQKVYWGDEIAKILQDNRVNWRLTINQSLRGFIDFLVKRTALRLVKLESAQGQVVRYTWGEANAYELALSLNQGSYLSHGTAVFLHGLTEQIYKKIYVNHEQSPKPATKRVLSQEAIETAFARPVRMSNAVFRLPDCEIISINGKHTGRLEVGSIKGPGDSQLEVTKLERTLIDITVRPVYAGGVVQVLETFKAARSQMSINVLLATLKRLDYAYPYHQCIGFYMERAGYEQSRIEHVRTIPANFKFYLTNEMSEADYDAKWRLFYPRGI
jgi:predicted transcriptional regulator of viral defense system